MLVTLGITLVLVISCVMLHYEAMSLLRRAGDWLHVNHAWHRGHLSVLVCGLLIAHVLEVILFGWGYYGLIDGKDYGAIVGGQNINFSDGIYFSFSSYSSLGYGDLVPAGPLRFMAGMEALTGLVLIGWTASFMYLQMRRVWERELS